MRLNLDIFAIKCRDFRVQLSYILLLLTILSYPKTSHGQKTFEEKREVTSESQKDSIRALLLSYYDLCYKYYRAEQHDSVIAIANNGISLAASEGLAFLEAQLTETKALSLEFLDIDQSIEVYLEAISAYKRAGLPNWIDEVKFEGVGNAHTILIRMYARKGNMVQAMYHYDLIEGIVEEQQYYTRKAMYESMAFAQSFAGDFEEAIRYFKLSISLSKQAAMTSGETVRGLEENHALIASYYQEINLQDSALHYILLARNIANDSIQSRIRGRAMVARIFGEILYEFGSIDSASYFLTNAYQQYEEIGDKAELSRTSASLARSYEKLGNMDLAKKFSQEAMVWADESGDLIALQASLKINYSILEKIGLFKEAIEINKRLIKVSSTISSRQNKMLTEAFAKRYEANEKQNQIDLQIERINRQRILLFAGSIIALLFLSLSFMAYRLATHRKKVNQLLVVQRDQLAQLDTAKSNFFANVSHELKTPLTLILAPLQNAIERSKNKNLNKDLARAYRNGKKLLGLVNELLDLSKLENDKLEVTYSAVNLFELAKRVTNSFRNITEIRNVKIILEYNLNKKIQLSLDTKKIEKILTNLISNAIKFSDTNSSILLKITRTSEDGLLLFVKDDGLGIAPFEQEKIFSRYYQINQGGAIQGGTGIGLALVSELVGLMGGTINVESALGKGSKFMVELPLIPRSFDIQTEKSVNTSSFDKQYKPKYTPSIIFESMPKILIIEDDIEMSQFLVDLLSEFYQCSTSYNGIEGLDQISMNQYDCVTCDVMMPEMDGFEFIKALRKKELSLRTPVLMLTARTLEEDLLKGFSLGVDDYVSKPFSKYELVARIRALVVNKRSRDLWKNEEGDKDEKIESFEMTQLKSAEAFVINHLSDPNIKVKDLADHMNYSIRQVSRITKKLTGLSPNNFIKEIRLQKAQYLITTKQFATIAEVRYEVGFQNSSYFSKMFLERFGVRPAELQ